MALRISAEYAGAVGRNRLVHTMHIYERMQLMNWEFVANKVVPVLWLWAAFILIGACVGVWLR
jgi:hypothetical protein